MLMFSSHWRWYSELKIALQMKPVIGIIKPVSDHIEISPGQPLIVCNTFSSYYGAILVYHWTTWNLYVGKYLKL